MTDNRFLTKGKWLLCRPDRYDVSYQINPWMNVAKRPDRNLALQQWQHLHDKFVELGAEVVLVPQGDNVPDMVFTANAGLVKDRTVILAQFKYKERQREESLFEEWFRAAGYEIYKPKNGFFEGEGDAYYVGDKYIAGYGFRSDSSVGEEIAAQLNAKIFIPVRLKDARFYHFDTCFCPLSEDKALIFREAFQGEEVRNLEKYMELIPVPDDEAVKFACNAVVIGKNVILPAGCSETEKLVTAQGFTPHPLQMTEFLKAGGASKCLSLWIGP